MVRKKEIFCNYSYFYLTRRTLYWEVTKECEKKVYKVCRLEKRATETLNLTFRVNQTKQIQEDNVSTLQKHRFSHSKDNLQLRTLKRNALHLTTGPKVLFNANSWGLTQQSETRSSHLKAMHSHSSKLLAHLKHTTGEFTRMHCFNHRLLGAVTFDEQLVIILVSNLTI